MEDVLLRTSPEYRALRKELRDTIKVLDTLLEAHRPTILSQTYLSGEDIMSILGISPRTLQNYRDQRIIPYTQLGGKFLYPCSEIEKILDRNYRKPLR